MGVYLVHGNCFRCGSLFSFNPHRVPSIPLKRSAAGKYEVVSVEQGGIREPICRACVEQVNPIRVKNGLNPIDILPGAYDPVDEMEGPFD